MRDDVLLEALLYAHEKAFNARRKWWEPYTWEHHGIGMSTVFEKEVAEKVGVKGKKIKLLRVYGVKEKQFLPFRAVLEFESFKLVFDRALHETGLLKMYEMETQKYLGSTQDHIHTVVFREKKGFNSNPINAEFYGLKGIEDLNESYRGLSVEKLVVKGNSTMAVGLLANDFIFYLNDNALLWFHTIELSKSYVRKALGKECGLKRLYVLGVKGGKLK